MHVMLYNNNNNIIIMYNIISSVLYLFTNQLQVCVCVYALLNNKDVSCEWWWCVFDAHDQLIIKLTKWNETKQWEHAH